MSAGSERSEYLAHLRALGFFQDRPHGLFQSPCHPLEGGESDVTPALLHKPVRRPVHFDVIGKSLLSPLLSLTMAADHLSQTVLK